MDNIYYVVCLARSNLERGNHLVSTLTTGNRESCLSQRDVAAEVCGVLSMVLVLAGFAWRYVFATDVQLQDKLKSTVISLYCDLRCTACAVSSYVLKRRTICAPSQMKHSAHGSDFDEQQHAREHDARGQHLHVDASACIAVQKACALVLEEFGRAATFASLAAGDAHKSTDLGVSQEASYGREDAGGVSQVEAQDSARALGEPTLSQVSHVKQARRCPSAAQLRQKKADADLQAAQLALNTKTAPTPFLQRRAIVAAKVVKTEKARQRQQKRASNNEEVASAQVASAQVHQQLTLEQFKQRKRMLHPFKTVARTKKEQRDRCRAMKKMTLGDVDV